MFRRTVRWIGFLCFIGTGPAAASWSPSVALSSPSSGTSGPQISVGANGTAAAVWSRYDGTNWNFQSSIKPRGGHWQKTPDTIIEPGYDILSPVVGVDSYGNAMAVWVVADGSGSVIKTSTKPYGEIWSVVPYDLSGSFTSSTSPQIAVNARGDAAAVFVAQSSNTIILASVKPHGGSWQTVPDTISIVGDGNALSPQVAIDPNGNVLAVWKINSGGNWIIQSSTKLYGGSWQTTPDSISQPLQDATDPEVALDANGNGTAVWSRFDGSNWVVQAITKKFGENWQITTDTLSLPGQDANNPQIGVDPGGSATVVWSRSNGTNWIVQSSSKPYGGTWQAVPDDVSSLGLDARLPQIAVDAGGTAIVVWESSNGEGTTILSSEKPLGATWTSPGTVSHCEGAASAQVDVSPSGYAVAAWLNSDNSGASVLSSEKSLVPPPPKKFKGSVRLGKKMDIKTKWKKSSKNKIVKYEIFAYDKIVKTIPAKDSLQATIRLSPHHPPRHLSKGYKRYLQNKYKIRAVDSIGAASACTMLKVEH